MGVGEPGDSGSERGGDGRDRVHGPRLDRRTLEDLVGIAARVRRRGLAEVAGEGPAVHLEVPAAPRAAGALRGGVAEGDVPVLTTGAARAGERMSVKELAMFLEPDISQ